MPTTIKSLKSLVFSGKSLLPLLAGVGLWLTCFNATAGDYNPAQVNWSQLTFRTSVFFITLQATVNLQKLASREAKSALIKPASGMGVSPNQKYVYLLKSHTAKFGRNSTLKLWFEADLTPLQRMEIETGRKNIVRTYRFMSEGAYRRDLMPTKSEKGQPPARWTKNSSHYYPYPGKLPSFKMTDNSVIFYAVSAADLNKKGDNVVFLTFDKERINEVKLRCEGFADIEAHYVEQSKSGEKRVHGKTKVLKIALQARPVGKEKDKKDFMFLGVKGDIHIYLDPKRHVPLQVSGKADYIGHTDIHLSKVIFSQ